MKIATSMIAAVEASLVLSRDSATTPDGAAPSGDNKTDDGSQNGTPAIRRPTTDQPLVDDYKITILSNTLIGRHTVDDWGGSAPVEITSGGASKRFLFDTGGNPDTVITNAGILGIQLCDIEDVVLSHNHSDHTKGLDTLGLDTLRSTCATTNPNEYKNANDPTRTAV